MSGSQEAHYDPAFYPQVALLIQPDLDLLPTLQEPEDQVDLQVHSVSLSSCSALKIL